MTPRSASNRSWEEPRRVPTTKQKKNARIMVTIAFVAITVELFYLGNFFYKALMGIS